MSYFLLITFIVALIAIFYIWYITLDLRSIPDDKILSLETDENKLLQQWFQNNITPSIIPNLDANEVAAKFLRRMFNIEVDSNLLVLGTNITIPLNHKLSSQYQPGSDIIFDLRSMVGVTGNIMVIHDPNLRSQLRRNNNYDPSLLDTMMDKGADLVAREYIVKVLEYRWNKLLELNDPNILNNKGSYLYLRDCQIPNVTTFTAKYGNKTRINLLCTDLEFETLLKRWSSQTSITI